MRATRWLMVCLLSVVSVGCGCPSGNSVEAERNVSGLLRWQSGDQAQIFDGHFLSSPRSGDGISYDRATIPMTGDPPPALPTDLVLFAMAPGCHTDATGASICDRQLRVRLTVHGVARGAASYPLDDAHAALELQVGDPFVAGHDPCPDKPYLTGCNANPTPDPPFVAYAALSGNLALSRLEEDCTDVLRECALAADGTFAVSASTPAGELVELTDGVVSASDSFNHRDANTCD
jgi:hypothetical protein